jgi:geranylgeranyl pyrophosphate synthase
VRAVYARCGVLDEAARVVQRTTREALAELGRLPRTTAREMLRCLAEELVHRES